MNSLATAGQDEPPREQTLSISVRTYCPRLTVPGESRVALRRQARESPSDASDRRARTEGGTSCRGRRVPHGGAGPVSAPPPARQPRLPASEPGQPKPPSRPGLEPVRTL